MNRKVPVRFGGGEKVEITSKPYLFLTQKMISNALSPFCKGVKNNYGKKKI